MEKAFSNSFKYIDKLSHTKKEQVYQWVKRYVDPTSSVGGRLINEMRETRFKDGFDYPHCAFEHVVRFGNVIVVKVALKLLPVQPRLSFIVLEKVTSGLHLLTVCSKDTPCVNLLKSYGSLGCAFLLAA